MAAVPSGAAPGVYKARRPQASPLFRLVSDHFRAFHHAYDERFAPVYGTGARWCARWPTSSSRAACSTTGSRACGVTRARTSICASSRARRATSARAATPSDGALDAVAGGLAPRGRGAAPPGGAHDPQAPPHVVSLPPHAPRRSRPTPADCRLTVPTRHRSACGCAAMPCPASSGSSRRALPSSIEGA